MIETGDCSYEAAGLPSISVRAVSLEGIEEAGRKVEVGTTTYN